MTAKKCTWLLAMILLVSLFGCRPTDSPGMIYIDSNYRTEYANVLDFDSFEGTPLFAVSFLGYGEHRMTFRNAYVDNLFESLGDEALRNVAHFDFDGDEWYLIVPRYKDAVEVIAGDRTETLPQGEAFTVRCNLSDLHPNLVIQTEKGSFSPQLGGDGFLIETDVAHDITDYSMAENPSDTFR